MSKLMSEERTAAWLEFVELYGNFSMASRKVGVGYSSFFKKRRREPDFDQAVEDRLARFNARMGFTAEDASAIQGVARRLTIGLAADAMRTVLRLPGKGRVVLDQAIADQARLDEANRHADDTTPPATPFGLLDQPMWAPLDGPQRQAYDCPADILLYGGAAGGGKSDLLLGLALTQHRRSILFRREYPQLKALEDRMLELTRLYGNYNQGRHVLRFKTRLIDSEYDRRLEFGAVSLPEHVSRFQGRAHDLKAFDEITHFTESQFRYLIGWNRSPDRGQRVRVVAAGNPPDGPEGDWILKFWGPWLDKQHPRPAQPGELRWYATLDGEEREVESGEPIRVGKEVIQPTSRSFIPARVEDNRYMMETGYKARLQSLPEPLRSRLLLGDFGVAVSDEPNQLLPTEWVKRAMDRWSHRPPDHLSRISHMGVDVARGGKDRTVIVLRHGTWFGWPKVWPGRETPDGKIVAQNIAHLMTHGGSGLNVLDKPVEHAIVQIDVIGVGGSVFDMVQMQGMTAVALSSAGTSTAKDRTGQLSFMNKRAEWWWRLREALDPHIGLGLMIPPDRELLADLTAPRWELSRHGIKVESKDAIRQRLGRSTDKGDALVYAWAPSESDAWIWVRRELERKHREDAREKPVREQIQVVARTTLGQPYFAFNPDGTRRPEVEMVDPRTVKPGPWWRFDKRGRFERLDPYAKYK